MEWVNILEKLPPMKATVLISKYDGRKKVKMNFVDIGYRLNSTWYYGNDGSEVEGLVTHWMPLPDPAPYPPTGSSNIPKSPQQYTQSRETLPAE